MRNAGRILPEMNRRNQIPIWLGLLVVVSFVGCRSNKSRPVLLTPETTTVWARVDTREPTVSDLPMVEIQTNYGSITLELFESRAPGSVANFLEYVEEGFYDGTIFHRVIPGFMIQGGGFIPGLIEKPTRAPIENEAGNGMRNLRGTIAMARTQDVDSATAQFYINLVDNAFLNGDGETGGYAVFGRVLSGMAVVDEISMEPTGTNGGFQDVPVNTVFIESIERIQ